MQSFIQQKHQRLFNFFSEFAQRAGNGRTGLPIVLRRTSTEARNGERKSRVYCVR